MKFSDFIKEAAGQVNEASAKNISGVGKVSVDQSEAKLLGVKDFADAMKKAPTFAKFIDNDKRFKNYKAVAVKGQPEAIAIIRDGKEEYELYFEKGALVYGGLFLERWEVEYFNNKGELPEQ